MSNPGRHGRNTMRRKQGTSVCRSFFSLLNMQSNNNEAAILPIDTFLEKSFPFTDITLEPNIVKYQSDYQILISEIVW